MVPAEELASCKDHTVGFVLAFAVPTRRTRPTASWCLRSPLGRGDGGVLLGGLVFPVSAGDPLTAVDSGGSPGVGERYCPHCPITSSVCWAQALGAVDTESTVTHGRSGRRSSHSLGEEDGMTAELCLPALGAQSPRRGAAASGGRHRGSRRRPSLDKSELVT